jgi:uncharacterized HAD superfamily protein
MNFCTVADMQRDIVLNRHRLPHDIDAVIGIPRSGMLAASMIALALNKPLGDLDGFIEGRMLSSGSTRRTADLERGIESFRHVLVVDDSSRTGAAMIEARGKLAAMAGQVRATCAVIYGVPDMADAVDLCLRVIHEPRVFEWNVMHHPVLAEACLDIDGVLCRDPRAAENDDGPAYAQFLLNTDPLHLPTRRIGALVTSRLEKYRPQTEAWLARHGVVYDRLVMLDLPDAEPRRRLDAHGRFKGEYYRDCGAWLFIESENAQARQIAAISGKPVLSLEGMVMCMPGALSPVAAMQNMRKPDAAKRAVRWALGDAGYGRLKRAFGRGGASAG